MFNNSIHYKASGEPVGKPISVSAEFNTCPIVSAGHSRHEYTTGTSQWLIMTQFGYKITENQVAE